MSPSEFNPDAKRLDIRLDFPRGSTFSCPECEQASLKAYDTVEKTWRHLNFFEHEAYLTARMPRTKCDKCGTHLVNVPWARPDSGFTLLFEAMIMTLAKSMPVKTSRAYHIRLNFQELYQQSADTAEAFLKKWYFWATHSRLEPIKKAAYTKSSAIGMGSCAGLLLKSITASWRG